MTTDDAADFSLALQLTLANPQAAVAKGAAITRRNRLMRQLEQANEAVEAETAKVDRQRHGSPDTKPLLKALQRYHTLAEQWRKAGG